METIIRLEKKRENKIKLEQSESTVAEIQKFKFLRQKVDQKPYYITTCKKFQIK